MRTWVAVCAALACFGVTSADAGSLIGDTVTIDYIYPYDGTVYATSDVLVGSPFPELTCAGSGAGSGVCSAFAEPATFDIEALSITLSENGGSSYSAAPFNGLDFTNLDFGDGSTLTGFTLSTNLPGLTASDVSFTANSIEYNGQGLSFQDNYFVTLDLTTSTSATPLPSTWTMLIAGFVVLGFLVAYRGKKKSLSTVAVA